MWKYAQVKVKDIDDNDNELTDEYQVFEVYDLDNDGVYEAFSKPSLTDLESLKMAIADIERDGINTWFYENGTFEWKREEGEAWSWDWTPRILQSELDRKK